MYRMCNNSLFHCCPLQDESINADKPNSRDPAAVAHSGFSLAASAYSQDQLYTNGGLTYSFRGYGALGNSLQNSAAAQSNGQCLCALDAKYFYLKGMCIILLSFFFFLSLLGPTDLSMKSVGSSSSSSSSNSHGQGGGGGGASAQLSPPEVTAVRQLIAGYRESAAFLLRSADELENLILQQN